MPNERTYLAVPYAERKAADKAGAIFDNSRKLWYAPSEKLSDALQQWLPNNTRSTQDLRAQFASFLRSHDVDLRGEPEMDGSWHRVTINGERKSNASYRGFDDGGVPNGQLKLFKGDETLQWRGEAVEMSREQREAVMAQAEHNREKKAEDLAKERDAAAKTAFGIWKNAPHWATQKRCDYLKRKGVDGYGVKALDDGRLLIPLRDTNGRLHNVQFVGKDKFFLENGRKEGLFHVIDPKRQLESGVAKALFIAEGYATAASVHKATGLPTLVAFDGGNLVKVAKEVREKYPDLQICIAADNDHQLPLRGLPNVGLEKGREAAKAINGKLIAPPLTSKEKAKGLTDWNDIHAERGLKGLEEALRQVFLSLSRNRSQDKKLGRSREMAR